MSRCSMNMGGTYPELFKPEETICKARCLQLPPPVLTKRRCPRLFQLRATCFPCCKVATLQLSPQVARQRSHAPPPRATFHSTHDTRVSCSEVQVYCCHLHVTVACIGGVWRFVLPPHPPPNELWALGFHLPWAAPPMAIRLPATPSAEWALRLSVLGHVASCFVASRLLPCF